MLEKAKFAKKISNIFTQPNFFLVNANTTVLHPHGLDIFYLKCRSLAKQLYYKSYVNFVNNFNFKFWLQLQSKLMVAMNTG